MDLTKHQIQYWMAQKLAPDQPQFNITALTTITGAVETHHFQQAFQETLNHTDALRIIIKETDGVPQQIIRPPFTYRLEVIDLSGSQDSESPLQTWLAERSAQPLDFTNRLFDTVLLKVQAKTYLWYWNAHHIITDGISNQLIYDRLRHFYQVAVDGLSAETTLYPAFQDYIAYEQQYQETAQYQTDQAYWQEKLAEPLEPLTFYGQSSTRKDLRTERVTYVLGSERTAQLQAIAAREAFQGKTQHVSLFNIFVGLFAGYLHLLSGNSVISIGTPFANRSRPDFKELVGLVTQTTPLVIDIQASDTLTSLIQAAQATSYQALEYRQYTIPQYPESPYDVVFNYHNETFSDFHGLPVEHTVTHSANDELALTLHLRTHTAENFYLQFDFHCDVFDPAQHQPAINHFIRLLDIFIADPETPLAQVSLLGDDERRQILIDWNDTAAPYDLTTTIHQHFEAQVARTPDATVLIEGERRLTYQQLNTQANQLAHYLIQQGVGPESLVGVSMERSPEMIISLLAILKAGGAYLPLDPNYPARRLNFMVTDAQPALILTRQHLKDRLPSETAPILCLETIGDSLKQHNPQNPQVEVGGDSIAYVLYTSGSTGTPKGVLGLHRGAVNRFKWMWETYPFADGEVCCHSTTLNFVDAVWEIFGPLLQGVPIVLISDAVLKDTARFTQALADHQVTRLVLVPSLLRVLLDSQPDLPAKLSTLKICVTSGEAIPVDLARRFLDTMPHTNLINLYGSSEVAADVTYFDLRQHPPHTIEPGVPIGQPIANTQIYLLDARLQPVPLGVPGELYVAGAGLARGYLDRPDLTAERFIQVDTLIPAIPLRLFKTGDLARWNETGQLEFLGRRDHQISIRGYRVELGEIEATLQQQPGVQQAVVIAREDTPGDKRIVTYLVAAGQDSLDLDSLRHTVRDTLPDYMIPAAFVPLEALPLTPNGKVNRLALPVPDYTQQISNTFIAPRTLTEETLTEIWESVLQVQPIGMNDNFFDLGGHSLLAIQTISRIQSTFQIELPFSALFDTPTIAGLGTHIEEILITELEALSEEEVALLMAEDD